MPPELESSRERVRQEDHDMLIVLGKTVELGFKSIKDDLIELKDGLYARVANLEERMIKAERIRDQVNPLETVKLVHAHERWINDFKTSWKNLLAAVTSIQVIIGIAIALGFKFLK